MCLAPAVVAAFLYLGSAAPSADGWNGAAARDRIALASSDGPHSALGDVNRDGFADFLIASSVFGGR